MAASTAANRAEGTYIRNGRVVSANDVTITDYITHAANLVVFFVSSIISLSPVREQVDRFNGSRTRTYGGSSNVNNPSNNRVGGGGAGGDRYQPRSNVNTFGPAAQSGCSGGS